MNDEAKKAMEALIRTQEKFDREEGQKLMAQWMKKKLNAMAMHPHQRNSATALTLTLQNRKRIN